MATATKTDSKAVKIALNLIKADHALQPRVEMDAEHWNRMARAYVEGDDVPPPIHLYFDGKFYWLVDGFHRYKAMWSIRHMGAKFTQIKAFVHEGTKQEAIAYAAMANLDNRSKPMSDLDRKKAMHMLMDLPEWREKSPSLIGKTFRLNSGTSKKYWLEYFADRRLPTPDIASDSRGHSRPTFTNSKKNPRPPVLSKSGSGRSVSVDGKSHYLGVVDGAKGREKLADILDEKEVFLRNYEFGHRVNQKLIAGNILSNAVISAGQANTHPGLSGRDVAGIAFTWESFRTPEGAVHAIGRAVCCRAKLGVSRAVVLCPVEDGPAEVLELGRKAGVEFMTIEDFVASLKPSADDTPTAEGDLP